MNFVIKNIAWLLLVVFFLFMLFIISSNEGEKKTSMNSGSILQEEEIKKVEDLDSLVKMMGEATESLENKEIEIKEELKKEEQGFFSRIFGKKENAGEDEKEGKNIEIEKQSNIQGNNNTKEVREVSESGDKRKLGNLKKYSGLQQEKSFENQYILENMYPGINLETAIGKKFEIGVSSLKLNNAYFNKTLGYMLQGDRITQLTEANSYGCFQVEVEKSKKRGYVCKKYLQNTTEAKKIEEEEPQQAISDIGDIISIEVEALIFANNITLLKGDTVDQMTNIDMQGCFIAHVYSSRIKPSVVPVGKICYKDIK